jgi:hypothetical protein
MPRRKKGQPSGRPGPAPNDPTPEQMARIPELKERAQQIELLGYENDLLLAAARLAQQVQARIEEAMEIRRRRKVNPNRPGRQLADEIVALETLEQSALAFVQKNVNVNGAIHPDVKERLDAWAADIAKDLGPVNHRIRAIRCLLRFAEDMLRAEVRLANAHEDVPLPGETEKQILDRLLETELGLKGVAAARALGRPEMFEKAECRQAERRTKLKDAALFGPESAFAEGFNASGAKASEEDLPVLDEIVRGAIAFAATVPGLDREVVRVNEKAATTARRRRG